MEDRSKPSFFKQYIVQKILWAIVALVLVVVVNILLKTFAGRHLNEIAQRLATNYTVTGLAFFISEILIGIFPAELFMIIYQTKGWSEYLLIVLILGIISSLCGFVAFLGGKYLNEAKISKMVMFQKKFEKYGKLFLKYGWVIIILAATTPLPFAMVSFISGYFRFSSATFLIIVTPVRIARFFIAAYFIKSSIVLV